MLDATSDRRASRFVGCFASEALYDGVFPGMHCGHVDEHAQEQVPGAFLKLLGKLIPRDIDASVKGGVEINWPVPRSALDQ